MAAKVFAFFALLALSVSAATAYISPVSPVATTTIPLYFPRATSIATANPCVQYYTLLQALASGILSPSSVPIQQPLAILEQQCQAYLAAQSIITVQQQQLVNPVATFVPNVFNQIALASPTTAAYWQQQQLLPNFFNQLALSSPVAYWQQQQLLPSVFNQLALANPAAYLQQQQLSNVFNQFALASPVAYWQQQQLQSNVFNQVALTNPAAYLQQPFIGGAIF